MATTQVYTVGGEESRQLELSDAVFGADVRSDLMHTMVVYQRAKRRSGNASTKERNEISGSTRKLYKQKGTGRARKGSIKSPILRGGGTIFGPKPRDYSKKMPKKARRAALKSALSAKFQNEEFIVLEPFLIEEPKTKTVKLMLDALEIDSTKVLFVTANGDQSFVNLRKSANNIEGAKTLKAAGVNVYDLLYADYVVATVDGVKEIEARLNI